MLGSGLEGDAGTSFALAGPMKFLALGLLALSLGCTRDTSAHGKTVPPDNTGVNTRDRDDRGLTPLDQSNDPADIDITKKIRQAVVDDDSLSSNAKNVKIITRGGKVTLRGPVKTDAEKSAIAAKAQAVAGAESVVNELEVSGR